jgi:hypothetical protein
MAGVIGLVTTGIGTMAAVDIMVVVPNTDMAVRSMAVGTEMGIGTEMETETVMAVAMATAAAKETITADNCSLAAE